MNTEQFTKMKSGDGFIPALDASIRGIYEASTT